MKMCSILFPLFLFFPGCGQEHIPEVPVLSQSVDTGWYADEELRIPFGKDGFAVQEVEYVSSDKAFYQYQGHVKFCEQPILPPDVQQVRSEDGWLCELYVLSKSPKEIYMKEIEELYGETDRRDFSGVVEETVQNHEVLLWREQIGKSRLDHILLLGTTQDYHFISSPYGDGEYIFDEVIEHIEFLK